MPPVCFSLQYTYWLWRKTHPKLEVQGRCYPVPTLHLKATRWRNVLKCLLKYQAGSPRPGQGASNVCRQGTVAPKVAYPIPATPGYHEKQPTLYLPLQGSMKSSLPCTPLYSVASQHHGVHKAT
ncbi:hypothetical protein CDAR_467061 [Caerostris darwini]|uniref:Uncharacterized protein n=1 Tax=Caerostris darwini TaxID=1538125 RepID=A0AAV4T966_9ARAC|nr:hypothetical protein CDAR_467061 [Caerostris darwini]